MSGNVGGTDGNPTNINIKRPLNLAKLDKLIGQSTEGSIWANYDSAENGGNANNVFDASEITAIKSYLSSEQNLTAEMLAYFEDEITRTQTEQPESKQPAKDVPPPTQVKSENQEYTGYTVQPGDTFIVIAKRLGLKGQEAKQYADELKAQLQANGQLDKRGWMRVGQKIQLPGNYNEALANNAEYSEDMNVLTNRYMQTTHAQKAQQNQQVQQTKKAQTRERTPQIPTSITKRAEEIKKTGGKCDIIKNDDGTFSIIQTSGGNYMTNNKISQVELKYDKSGTLICQRNSMQSGKIIEGKWANGKMNWKTIAVPVKTANNKTISVPVSVKTRADNMIKAGDKCKIQKQSDGSFKIIQTAGSFMTKYGISKIEILYDKDGKLTGQNNYYNNGSQKLGTYKNGKMTYKTVAAPAPKSQATVAPAKTAEQKQAERARMLMPGEWSYPEALQDRIVEYRQRGVNFTLTQTLDGFRMELKESAQNNYSLNVPNVPVFLNNERNIPDFLKENKILTLDKDGNILQEQKEDALGTRITTTRYVDGVAQKPVITNKEYVKYGDIDAQRTYTDNIATQIGINRPKDLNDDGTEFANSLEQNKARLMSKLGITNEQYNVLANMAMGIAEQETHFGKMHSDLSTKKDDSFSSWLRENISGTVADYYNGIQLKGIAKQTMDAIYYSDSIETVMDYIPGISAEDAKKISDSVKKGTFRAAGSVSSQINEYYDKFTDGTKSYGMTQIKVDELIKGNATLAKQFAAFGITKGEDIRTSPKKQAIATVIVLNNKRMVLNSSSPVTVYNNVTKQNEPLIVTKADGTQGTVTTRELFELNNSKLPENERLSELQQIAILYNGFGTKKKNLCAQGQFGVSRTPYARNVAAWADGLYKVDENQTSRNRANALGAVSQGNNGKIGTVIFMPKAYTTNVTNSKEDIQTLEDALSKNTNIPQALKDKLVIAVRQNEIAFGYGLKPEEAASITAKDVKLMLDKLNLLKNKISDLVDPARIRQEAQQTQDNFRSAYLQSRQVVVNNFDVGDSTIIPALSSGDIINERLVESRETVVTSAHRAGRGGGARRAIARDNAAVNAGNYKGFTVQEDLGVNPYDANGNLLPRQQRELAEFASDVSRDMGTGGLCMTGIKATLESAGVIKKGEIVYPKGHKDWGKPIENAKDLRLYLNAHPEKFEEVKYVSLGNGTSRELNASDIKKLPAGYIGVFIPGAGYEDQAGHAFITNGNGQGYADEVDNLRWDDFKSTGDGNGKGEHGTFKIYRLKV